MIERVAKAVRDADILELAKRYPELGVSIIREKADECWGDHLSMARAAIEAMRSYTDEMARKGCRAIQDFEEEDPQGMMMDFRWRSCWNAMISAALSEAKGPTPSKDTLSRRAVQ